MASGAINEVIQMELAKVRQFNAERDEHERLRSAVVEAAQAEICNATEDLTNAVDALNKFEASHAVGQKDE